jgi:hypothetical protein
MYSSDRHSNNPFLTPNRAQSVSPGPSSPGISRMGSPNHLAYGPRAGMASSPTAYTPSTSQAALLPPQQQGQMHDGAVPLSRQSSASSMNSGDGFFRNGRYAGAASPVGGMSRSSSPMYEGQTLPYGAVAGGARGRGVNEKAGYPGTPSSMAPSMQDKVRPPPSFVTSRTDPSPVLPLRRSRIMGRRRITRLRRARRLPTQPRPETGSETRSRGQHLYRPWSRQHWLCRDPLHGAHCSVCGVPDYYCVQG